MTSAEVLVVSFEEYLAFEEGSERRHEWVAGHVYAMAGGTERHDNMVGLIYERLLPQARGHGCRPYMHNRKVKIEDTTYYPDVVVICPGGPSPDPQFERDLTVVVEVLSPSTEVIDRREKAVVYPKAPSFRQYLIVDTQRRKIEVLGRDGRWTTYISGDVIPEVEIDVDALYDQVDAVTVT